MSSKENDPENPPDRGSDRPDGSLGVLTPRQGNHTMAILSFLLLFFFLPLVITHALGQDARVRCFAPQGHHPVWGSGIPGRCDGTLTDMLILSFSCGNAHAHAVSSPGYKDTGTPRRSVYGGRLVCLYPKPARPTALTKPLSIPFCQTPRLLAPENRHLLPSSRCSQPDSIITTKQYSPCSP